jgi:hypothetical protein
VLGTCDGLALGAELDHLDAVAAGELLVVGLLDPCQVARAVGSEVADQPQRRLPRRMHAFGGALQGQHVHQPVLGELVDRRLGVVGRHGLGQAHPGVVGLRGREDPGQLGPVHAEERRQVRCQLLQVDAVLDALVAELRHVGHDPLAGDGDGELDAVAVEDRAPLRRHLDASHPLVLALGDELVAVAELHTDELQHRQDGQDGQQPADDHHPLAHVGLG